MMDNEQPWLPLAPQKIHSVPMISPQVPEVTLFSPGPANNKNKFLQRAIANERISNKPNNFIINDQNMKTGSAPNVKPSVPDLSLFEVPSQAARPIFNRAQDRLPDRAPQDKNVNDQVMRGQVQNQIFCKSKKQSQQFEAFGQHSVPDVTILNEEPKQVQQEINSSSSNVFGTSYRNMLTNSHEQFMKQIKDNEPECDERMMKPKQSVFNKVQVNPLRKYAPKPQPAQTMRSDPDTSSILEDFGDQRTNDEHDETTFKKVAEMLSKMQKLASPGANSTERASSQATNKEPATKTQNKQTILHHLAKSFLTLEEQEFFDVRNEIDELEEES